MAFDDPNTTMLPLLPSVTDIFGYSEVGAVQTAVPGTEALLFHCAESNAGRKPINASRVNILFKRRF